MVAVVVAKWKLGVVGLEERMAAEGEVAKNENPDDAAADNSGGIGLAPCICHAQSLSCPNKSKLCYLISIKVPWRIGLYFALFA